MKVSGLSSGQANVTSSSGCACAHKKSTRLGLSFADLCQDPDDLEGDPCHAAVWETPRRIAEAAFNRGAEGILVPSASRRSVKLIVFPENLRPGSIIEVTGELYEPRWSRR
jgi:hypothetical protein